MQIKTDEKGNIIQSAEVGGMPDGIELDLSMYKLIDGNLILDKEKLQLQQNAVRGEEIKARLTQIDVESVRPLRAALTNTANDFDNEKLADLEAEAADLRAELKGLI